MGTFTVSYDNLNRRNNMTMGNGITATYTFDGASQLTNLVFKDGAVTKTSHQYPLFDDVGNIKTEIDLSGTHNYNYDELYRLTSATHPAGNPNEFFNYIDPVGSVGNRTSSHLSSSYRVNELNRLTEDDSYIYGYDVDGNLISKQNKSTNEITYFYFDAENKLVQVDKYNSTPTLISSVSYAYDGFGRRVKKNVNGTVAYYIYDNEDIRFETDGAGNITAEYSHGPGIDEPLSMRRGGQNYYYHTNGLGSVAALTNTSKAIVQSYIYDSFGQIISQTGSIQNPYTFTGREYDSETGLYYYRARYYDPKIGKFISPDPIGLNGGINLYSYVGNNPVRYVDPFGLANLITNMAEGTTTFDPRPEDPNGVPFTVQTRNDVTRNSLLGARDPFTTPDVNPIENINSPAFGPPGAYIDTGDPRGRDIHGGGSGLIDPYAPRQGWKHTKGCTRGQNEDVQELNRRISDFKLRHPGVKIPYTRR